MSPPPPLTNAELALMELLWEEDALTARQLREALYPNATRAQHGTVQKLLSRLEDKGYVARDRSLSAQFEHSIGVTKDGAEIFTLSPAGRFHPTWGA